jgi:ACS family pantothenate transporter-like MFS transporter
MSVDDSKGHDTVQPEKKNPRWISYLWDTFDKPPAERRLLMKLDAALLCFGAVGKFFFFFFFFLF